MSFILLVVIAIHISHLDLGGLFGLLRVRRGGYSNGGGRLFGFGWFGMRLLRGSFLGHLFFGRQLFGDEFLGGDLEVASAGDGRIALVVGAGFLALLAAVGVVHMLGSAFQHGLVADCPFQFHE